MKLSSHGRVGLFGIGLAAYWSQFEGLKQRLEGYQQIVHDRLARYSEIIDAGLIDSACDAAKARDQFAAGSLDLIVCYVGTYATSSQVLPAVQRLHIPVLILNLQPVSSLDYGKTDTGEWLANCCACCVPEISCAFSRSGIDFHVVTGVLGVEGGRFGETPSSHPQSQNAWMQITEWVRATSTVNRLRRSRIGFLGHTYPGMLDMYSDFTQHSAQLGTHIEVLEMCDLAQRLPKERDPIIKAKRIEAQTIFQISEDSPTDPLAKKPTDEEMDWACRVAVGLDRLVEDFSLDGLTYYYRGLDGNNYEKLCAGMILGCSMLTAGGIPTSGEGDLKNCQAMKIMDLIGCGGSYTEFYAMDFDEDYLLMGHDGPFHVKIAEGKPILRGLGLYHGKRGRGVSVEATVKHGPITLLALTQTAEGKLKFIVAEGESIPGPTLQIGNTNSRIKFAKGMVHFVSQWCEQGPTHHCALGVGHVRPVIRRIISLLGRELVEIT